MESSLYVSLSSQLALEKRLTTIADNVANAGTVGFRATEVKFDQLISRSPGVDVSYVSPGDDYLSTKSGGLEKTGNALDFAVKGNGWFAINTPAGQVLTRDGRFSMTPTGALVSTMGYPVLDAGGAPIQLDPTAGAPVVSQDGSLHQNGNLVAAIGLFSADLRPGYSRFENSGVIPVQAPQPIVDRSDQGVLQGYVEQSNVNPIAEMTKLIMVQRAFDNAAVASRTTSGSLDQAVKVLGGTS
ncbi:MAG TPA: flagellar basal-body rod protein FlgF [Pararhizobium sp.]|nr:flagellar basal-body rod protein FlgF [Pararhizobium sp.]